MSNILVPIDTGLSRPYMLEITSQDVPMRGLQEPLHGATFVHLSDLHGGYGATDPVFEEAIARVSALKPDLILFTGDYIDDHANNDYPIQKVLSRFHAPLGVFGSFGNHEHRRGIVGSRRIVTQSGVRLLENESVRLEPGLWLAGIDDTHEGSPDIARALADVPADATTILLSHNPRILERLPDRDLLILSGHTHGGQINLPFPTPKMVCWFHLRCRQVAGWYRNGKTRLYVNRGLGVTGKPYRFRCPAEIAVFRLVPDPEDTRTAPRHTHATPEPVAR